MKTYLNFIKGEWKPAESGETFSLPNPADIRETVASFPRSGKREVQNALQACRNSFTSWSKLTPIARGRFLSKAAQILESRKNDLARSLTIEEGKTLAESQGEVQRAIDIFRFFGGWSYTLGGTTIPHDLPNNLLYTIRQPLGVVGLITPWNFPIAIPAWKMAPALLAGNTVLIKPASQVPGPALELARALQEAGLPEGVLNVVVGEGREVGESLVADPCVQALSFTGSYPVGYAIYQILAKRMARAQMEMGSKNPTIVLADADLDLAATLVMKAAFGLTGQACTATSRVLVASSVIEPFTQKLIEKTRSIKVGNGLDPDVTMGPAVSQSQLDNDLKYIDIALQQGARLLYGGGRTQDEKARHGFFMNPAILADVTPNMRIACEEVFGPVVGIIPVQDLHEALEIANGVEVGLSAAIVTRDLQKAMSYAERIEAGVVKINQISTGLALQAPFGGVKKSSTDTFREQGPGAIEFYSRLKTVYLDYSV